VPSVVAPAVPAPVTEIVASRRIPRRSVALPLTDPNWVVAIFNVVVLPAVTATADVVELKSPIPLARIS